MPRPKKNKPTEYTQLEKDLLEAADAMLAHEKDIQASDIAQYAIPEEVDTRAVRDELHLTQEQFSHLVGVSVHAVRHWENGRRMPDAPVRILIAILHRNPDVVLDVLSHPDAM